MVYILSSAHVLFKVGARQEVFKGEGKPGVTTGQTGFRKCIDPIVLYEILSRAVIPIWSPQLAIPVLLLCQQNEEMSP